MNNFLCGNCSHSNKAHVSLKESFAYNGNSGRLCTEYEDAIFIKGNWFHNKEQICMCKDFVFDNLKYLEELYEEKQCQLK